MNSAPGFTNCNTVAVDNVKALSLIRTALHSFQTHMGKDDDYQKRR